MSLQEQKCMIMIMNASFSMHVQQSNRQKQQSKLQLSCEGEEIEYWSKAHAVDRTEHGHVSESDTP